MVAKIKSGKSLIGALYYNENKVTAGKAKLIAVNGYAKDHESLSFDDKLFRLKDLASRNLRTRTNTLHLSLNFDLTEQLESGKLTEIADDYMKRIGFENQPYLIYKHFDAGHPHIHIVSTNIEPDGTRISLHNIGELKSEPARKAIEVAFGLVQASGKNTELERIENSKIQPLEYGTIDTKRAIKNIVNEVTKSYKFTSLPELNAILSLYNVNADSGTRESVMFKHGGLLYWVIDKNGKKTGVPIKASSIYQKPTLKLLEGRFKLNEFLRKPFKDKLKVMVDKALASASSLDQFKSELKKAEVSIIVRQNSEGRIYGISYIDHVNKAVFNGSDLGKSYSAAAVLGSIQQNPVGDKAITKDWPSEQRKADMIGASATINNSHSHTLLDDLLMQVDPNANLVNEFGPRKTKKKRKKLNL